jgi:hypothetical protein
MIGDLEYEAAASQFISKRNSKSTKDITNLETLNKEEGAL